MSAIEFDYYRSCLELALLQKAEASIRETLKKPSESFYVISPYEWETNLMFIEYAHFLFKIIDLDRMAPQNGFQQFYDDLMDDLYDVDYEYHFLYRYDFGLLIDGVRKYGEEPFQDLIDELKEIMEDIPGLFITNMSDYVLNVFDCQSLEHKYYWEMKNYAYELKYTYFIYLDLAYGDPSDTTTAADYMPYFAERYIGLYEKIINRINSLRGDGQK